MVEFTAESILKCSVTEDTGGGGGGPSAGFDPATVSNVTLSGSNLVATNTGTTSVNQGARLALASAKSSNKYYFEVTYTTSTTGANVGVGVGTTASTYTSMGNSAITGAECYMGTGNIWSGGAYQHKTVGGFVFGNTIGVAVDFDNRAIWFKKLSGGNWNGSSGANPATNSGGVTIPAGLYVPFVTFGGSSGGSGGKFTANFGGSAFVGSLPSGFVSGWPQ
ncbi:hypothetical protein ACVWYH_003101 [Bradyrhizobium sp. GM24.11]